jgi:hypothetical protein
MPKMPKAPRKTPKMKKPAKGMPKPRKRNGQKKR